MSDPIESRRFNREALEQDEDVAMFVRELDVVMASALEPMDPSVGLLGRLQATVTEPAHRYAPFIDRVADLFDLSSDDAATQCAKLADPKAWRFAGLPGVHNIAVRGGPKVAGAETVFARFAPGTRFPKHCHGGFERVLVLEG